MKFLTLIYGLMFGVCRLYDNMWDDGNSLGPKELHSYLTRVMYNRRNKFDPLWNSLVLGGVKNGQKYLGMVSHFAIFNDSQQQIGHFKSCSGRFDWVLT